MNFFFLFTTLSKAHPSISSPNLSRYPTAQMLHQGSTPGGIPRRDASTSPMASVTVCRAQTSEVFERSSFAKRLENSHKVGHRRRQLQSAVVQPYVPVPNTETSVLYICRDVFCTSKRLL